MPQTVSREDSVMEVEKPVAAALKKEKLSNLDRLDEMPIVNHELRFRNTDKHKGKLVLGAIVGGRTSHAEGFALQVRGTINVDLDTCIKCAAGGGPFQDWVSLPDLFDGSCAECQYNAHPASCSLRPPRPTPPPGNRKRVASSMSRAQEAQESKSRKVAVIGKMRRILISLRTKLQELEEI